MTLTEIVARNLRAMRVAKGVPQAVLATRANVSVSYVSMLERGHRTPPLATLEAVAKALRVSPLDLLQEKARRSSPVRKRGRSA